MPGQPWFAWEWAWDVTFAGVHKWTGLAGVAFVNTALLSLISVLLFRLIRRYSDNDILAFALTMLAICGSMIHWLARPHLVSWVFALVFSHLILSSERGNRKALYWTPVLMVLWTNLHGGFVVGIVLLAAAAIGEALQVTLADANRTLASYTRAFEYFSTCGLCIVGHVREPVRLALTRTLDQVLTRFFAVGQHQRVSIDGLPSRWVDLFRGYVAARRRGKRLVLAEPACRTRDHGPDLGARCALLTTQHSDLYAAFRRSDRPNDSGRVSNCCRAAALYSASALQSNR